MAAEITYTDKTLGQESEQPTDKKWRYQDANEVKVVVNSHKDDIEAINSDIATINSDLNDLNDQVINGRVIVNQLNVSTTLGGVIDSTKEYFVDGIIDMTGVSCEVPTGGLVITGSGGTISKLICSDDNYTMFTSPVGGGGSITQRGFGITSDGVNSKVYELVSDTGFSVFGATNILWQNCTSLGSLDTFFQGIENVTTRTGGTPELELIGTWIRGYFISTSNSFGLDDSSFSLYKGGVGFLMNGRFRSNANIDLSASASFIDFVPSNFVLASSLDLTDCLITRNNVPNADDSNLTPNISSTDLPSYWKNNNGLNNTHVGGNNEITTEIVTVINTISVYEDLNGTFTASDLQHFDSPSNGQLRHLGNSPRDYRVTAHIDLDGASNNELEVLISKWDDSASSFLSVASQLRVVNNFQGARDVAFFNITSNTTLDKDDYIKIQVRNNSGTGNVTGELEGYFLIEER